MSKKMVLFIVLIASIVALGLQLLQTRILSFVLWYHLVYIVITMALLGFAASGTAYHVSKRLRQSSDSDFYTFALMGLSISALFSTRLGYYPVNDVFALTHEPRIIIGLTISYFLFMVPYFFAGLVIIRTFLTYPDRTGRIYFSNLLGSGLGCVVFILLIERMGASHLLVLFSFLSITPLLFTITQSRISRTYKKSVLLWAGFLIILFTFSANSVFHNILPEKHKQFWTLYGSKGSEFSKWNPISRIDIVSSKEDPRYKNILMDGDAQAIFYDPQIIQDEIKAGRIDRSAVYRIKDANTLNRALIIGAGGGFDVTVAKLSGVKTIDAVEINPMTAKITSKLFPQQIGHLYSSPNIHLHVEDGRSFVRRSQNKYDVIVLYYTDSTLALSTGAYTLCDNFLYTKEAFHDYLDHLTENGIIQIGRWEYNEKPRETLRIFSIALSVLKDRGVSDPGSHIAVISARQDAVGNVLFKRNPFTKEERKRLSQFCDMNSLEAWFPDYTAATLYAALITTKDRGVMALPPRRDPFTHEEKTSLTRFFKDRGATVKFEDNEFLNEARFVFAKPFQQLANNYKEGTERSFYAEYDFNVTPTTDDSPFFYNYNKVKSQSKDNVNNYYDNIKGVWHIFVLTFLFWNSLILTTLLVLLPFVLAKKRISFTTPRFLLSLYFIMIGFGFMLLEMGALQKFVLFLGSPIYSMSVLIPAILIAAGLGSYCSGSIKKNLTQWTVIFGVTCGATILSMAVLIPKITAFFLSVPLPARILIAVATIFPAAFCMGFPFPLTLRLATKHHGDFVPILWAINGSSSVIASIVAIIIAMAFGFKLVLILSGCFYLVSALFALLLGHSLRK